MKRLCLLLMMIFPLLTFAEDAPLLTVQIEGQMYRELPGVEIADADFADWLRSLLSVDAPCEPPEVRPAHVCYRITFGDTGETWSLWHDDLYDRAAVTRPDGTVHAVSTEVPAMLHQLTRTTPRFDIPAEHRALLAERGWTAAFRIGHDPVRLPETLAASRTDAGALHFTFADLFLREAGYDITPYLGREVQPCVYVLLEQVNRIAWKPEDVRLLDENGNGGVLCSLYAVVLECDGQVIGAYLKAWSWDGADLMSLSGKTAVDLLADSSIRQYLLDRLSLTDEERALAALSPEEVLRRYAAWNDPVMRPIEGLLSGTGTASAVLYGPMEPLTAHPTGRQVKSVRQMEGEGLYEVTMDDGETYYPRLVRESPETGWKVQAFYNTGY